MENAERFSCLTIHFQTGKVKNNANRFLFHKVTSRDLLVIYMSLGYIYIYISWLYNIYTWLKKRCRLKSIYKPWTIWLQGFMGIHLLAKQIQSSFNKSLRFRYSLLLKRWTVKNNESFRVKWENWLLPWIGAQYNANISPRLFIQIQTLRYCKGSEAGKMKQAQSKVLWSII